VRRFRVIVIKLRMRFHYKRLAVSAKNLVVIRSMTGESGHVLRPDYGRIGRDSDRQNRARQFFPEFRFYGEILAEVVGGCGSFMLMSMCIASYRVGFPWGLDILKKPPK
jgi:hypothetical protein